MEVPLRILIVTHAFPPMNAIGSHRSYGWAKAWRDERHEIHVLTPVKHAFDGTMDLERDLHGIHVHEVPYLVRRPTSARPFAERHRVERWEGIKTATRRVRSGFGMFGDVRLLAYRPMVDAGFDLARRHPFDLIIATSPPEVSFFVARSLAKRTGAAWFADFRDAWFRDLRFHHTAPAAWLAGRVNRWLVKPSAGLITVSQGLQRRLSADLGCDVRLAYNGFFEADHEPESAAGCVADGRLHIVYTGRIYPGRQNPEPLFEALALLKRSRTDLAQRLRVDIYGHDEPAVRRLVERFAVHDCVTLHGFVRFRRSLDAQLGADELLFLDWTAARSEGMLTGKLLEYLGSRRPIVALGLRRDSEAACLLERTGCGVTLITVPEVVAHLERLLRDGRPAPVDSPARERFSRDAQARTLLAELVRVTQVGHQ